MSEWMPPHRLWSPGHEHNLKLSEMSPPSAQWPIEHMLQPM